MLRSVVLDWGVVGILLHHDLCRLGTMSCSTTNHRCMSSATPSWWVMSGKLGGNWSWRVMGGNFLSHPLQM